VLKSVRNYFASIPQFRYLKRRASFYLWKLKILLQTMSLKNKIDATRLYWIDPARITHYYTKASKAEKPIEEIGLVVDGQWDQEIDEVEKMDVVRAFRGHFQEGKQWEHTDFYARIISDICAGRKCWNCASEDEFKERLSALETLYIDIQKNGYMTQDELKKKGGFGDFHLYGVEDEVRVHIGRNGDYLFADGRHRLAIAKILNLKSIPVKVSRRHKKWLKLRKEILSYAEEESSGKVYQPILHPDLVDIPSAHSKKRWELMRPHVECLTGRMLDIGANWGYFSHCFESIGFDCLAIEVMPRGAYFLRKLRRAENRKFQIVEASILDYKGPLDFTVVLGLNIFHHFLKTEQLFKKLSDFLGKLNCEVMFFQPHLIDEPQMQKAYKNYGEEEYLRFIKEKVRLSKVTLLGKDDDGRKLYKIER